jgi:predicted phage terminase large subunit-like protein
MTRPKTDPRFHAIIDAVDREFVRRECRDSLYAFVKRYWSVVEPGAEFVDNWHIEAICEHLEAVTRRQIKRLVINVPFRTAKSTITSVLWPAWVWITDPSHQWLTGSYADKLALRDALKTRRLIMSAQYQQDYGEAFQFTKDQNQKHRYDNTKNGYRISFGITGGVMGDGGNTILLDDPHDRRGANSEAERPDTLVTFDEAVVTRLNKPATDAIVIIMQRLHHLDLSGHVLKQGGWDHLMIPMEFEPSRRCVTSLGWRDPRVQEGELMFPKRFPRATVNSLKVNLGEYGYAGQLQQRPSPDGGGILKPSHFQLWPAGKPVPQIAHVIQSYDTAYTADTANDPCACTVWGIFGLVDPDTGKLKRCAMLMDAWDEHLPYPKLKPKVIKDWNQKYGGDRNDPLNKPRRPDIMIIEEKGSGISLIQDLRSAALPVIPYNPGRASKITRAHLVAPLLETDCFYVLESTQASRKGKCVAWAQKMMDELEQFPNGEHDDYVDTFTQASIYLQRSEHLLMPKVPKDEILEKDYEEERRKKTNPYAA